jgi:hypothetical protein
VGVPPPASRLRPANAAGWSGRCSSVIRGPSSLSSVSKILKTFTVCRERRRAIIAHYFIPGRRCPSWQAPWRGRALASHPSENSKRGEEDGTGQLVLAQYASYAARLFGHHRRSSTGSMAIGRFHPLMTKGNQKSIGMTVLLCRINAGPRNEFPPSRMRKAGCIQPPPRR